MQPLSAVLDQAREKLNLTGTSSVLKHGNSVLDLSVPLRFASIPAGAKLELDTGANLCLPCVGALCKQVSMTMQYLDTYRHDASPLALVTLLTIHMGGVQVHHSVLGSSPSPDLRRQPTAGARHPHLRLPIPHSFHARRRP